MSNVRLAQPRRRFDQRIKHSLQIERRAADHLQDIGGGGLLLQRFAQLVEQPRVLDGDDGLGCEIGHQLDLLVGEWADFLAKDHHNSDQFILLEYWYGEVSSNAAKFDSVDHRWITFNIKLRCRQIGEVGRRFDSDYVAHKGIRVTMEWTASG